MPNFGKFESIKYMRWAARSIGLSYGIFIICIFIAPSIGSSSPCPLSMLLPAILFGAPFIIMVALAWKWPSRWPELFSGILFTLWGLFLLVSSGYYALASESTSMIVAQFSTAVMLAEVCPPLITGILFVLAYRMACSAKD